MEQGRERRHIPMSHILEETNLDHQGPRLILRNDARLGLLRSMLW